MDKIDLDELERLHKEATPGPWVANNWGRVWYTPNPDRKRLVCDTMRNTVRNPKSWRANARLIAAMREALPELIAENRALQERVRELEAQREILAGKIGTLTRWYDAMAGCEVCEFTQDCDNSEACCTNAIIQWAEEAAKEDDNV